MQNLLNYLESYIPLLEKNNKKVSKSNVGWHIEHSLLSIDGIIDDLKNSDESKYVWKFNPIRSIVFLTNIIPRGRAESPERVLPEVNITEDKLKKHISEIRLKLKELNNLKKNQYFDHMVFGRLNLKQSIKCMKVHTYHHIKIIKDILK